MGRIRGEVGGEAVGTIGDVTIAVWRGMKVVRRKRGPSTAPPSESQRQQWQRFLFASQYAKEVGADPEKRAVYEALVGDKPTTWRALAMQDYLGMPVIAKVNVEAYRGQVGDPIDIYVQDVTCRRVHVRLLNPDQAPEGALGVLVEEGEAERAVPGQDFHWVYRARTAYPGPRFTLVVEATDLPGNTTTTTVEGEL